MTFLNTWPIQKFTDDPNAIKSIVFNRDQVITLDSNSSKFIYVIKSGSISIFIQVNQKSKSSINNTNQDSNESDTNKSTKNEAGYFPYNHTLDDHHKEHLLLEGMLKKRTDEEIRKDIESKMRLNEVMTYLAQMKKLDQETTKEVEAGSSGLKERLEILSSTHHHHHHATNDKLENIMHFLQLDDTDSESLEEDDEIKTKRLHSINFSINKVTQSNKNQLQ